MKEVKFAPKEIFNQILEWSVIPTFDLLLDYGDSGIIIAKRKISPYKNTWALPGLRMYKGENLDETLKRIAKNEIGLDINPAKKVFIGQYVGKFKTEHQRQDISTGYLVEVDSTQEITLNSQHFSSFKVTKDIPKNMGAMYKFYMGEYLKLSR